MDRAFKLPDLGEGVHEGEILAVHVAAGQEVAEGELVLTIETDKAAVEIPSPYTGTVMEIRVKAGDVVRVGQVMLTFNGAGAQARPEPSGRGGALAEGPRTPADSEPAEGTKQTPEKAQPGPIEAALERRRQDELPQEGPGQRPPELARRDAGMPSGGEAVSTAAAARRQGPVPASPATRRLARELGVDLQLVPGSGPQGLVTAADVQAFAQASQRPRSEPAEPRAGGPAQAGQAARAAQAAPVTRLSPAEHSSHAAQPSPSAAAQAAPAARVDEGTPASGRDDKQRPAGQALPTPAPELPDFAQWGAVERVPVRSIRRATARRMALSWSQIPHVSSQDSANITRLDQFRRKHKDALREQGGRLTLTVFALKAAATALKRFPDFNASLDTERGEIIRKHYYNIGVAADTPDGLVVPVIRDVDRKSIRELAVELTQLLQRARERRISRQEMQGGTFTITNAGAMGGAWFTPLINFPETAILGMGQARMQPVAVRDGQDDYSVVPQLILPLVVCIDHRVLDGADAIGFLKTMVAILEDPDELLISAV